jgi:hypothetical protein
MVAAGLRCAAAPTPAAGARLVTAVGSPRGLRPRGPRVDFRLQRELDRRCPASIGRAANRTDGPAAKSHCSGSMTGGGASCLAPAVGYPTPRSAPFEISRDRLLDTNA